MTTLNTATYNIKDRADSALFATIDSTTATITCTTAQGTRFPLSNFIVYVDSEKMSVANRTTDTFSGVVRGLDGTTASTHVAGSRVIHPFESLAYQSLLDNISGHTHEKADITDFAHSHDVSGITNFSHSHDISGISNFSHTHDISGISELTTSLAAKSNVIHQHYIDYTSSFLGTLVNLTANTYATGPSINISTGTWMIWGSVTVRGNTATAHQMTAKLWNGSANPVATTMAAAPSQGTNLRSYRTMTLGPTVQTLTTTATWVVSVATVGANANIAAAPDLNAPTGTAASFMAALRIG